MNSNDFNKEALAYHAQGKPGKVDVQSSKKCTTEYDLSLAYSPGVAAPCLKIKEDESLAYRYTTKGNLVAVITNGSAVLGLGNIGPLASKPVMEGKGVLFKQFAGIDVFDIELKAKNCEEFIQTVKNISPTFGGINLEDISAPDCFVIEERLKKELDIPVFHDDQHGTAIICGAAFLNACKIAEKKTKEVKVVFNGAGAAALSSAKLFLKLGVQPKNLLICDSKGVVQSQRTDLNKYKKEFALKTPLRTLAAAIKNADVFCGLSVANVLTEDMLRSMSKNPIVFAMANPDPEISPQKAHKARSDIIMATGRSDFPNQVNNVLGFPSIFRGALDTMATEINSEMELAAVHALAQLAQEEVPESVSNAYGDKIFQFGSNYIIPKPFDPRVLTNVAPAVAKAAMKSGVARHHIKDLQAYSETLEAQQSLKRGFIRSNINRIHTNMKRKKNSSLPVIVFPEGKSVKVLRALNSILKEKIVRPILLGYEDSIQKRISQWELDNLKNVEIIHPSKSKKYQKYVEKIYNQRKRRGVMLAEAENLIKDPYYFASMMVKSGDADGLISGATQNYASSVKPILEVIGCGKFRVASGLSMIIFKDKLLFLADTTMNINPSAHDLATIAIHASTVAEYFNCKPKVAMLSYSNFTGKDETPKKMCEAASIVKRLRPDIVVDGEMQADTAIDPNIVESIFPFCDIKDGANVLIFPDINSGNIGYKLVKQLSEGEVVGPFLMGVQKPANVLQRTCGIDDIINTIVLTSLQTQVVTKPF